MQTDKLPVRGIELGRHMLQMILLSYNSRDRIPGFRFPVYHTSAVPSLDKWNVSVERMIFHALQSLKFQHEPS